MKLISWQVSARVARFEPNWYQQQQQQHNDGCAQRGVRCMSFEYFKCHINWLSSDCDDLRLDGFGCSGWVDEHWPLWRHLKLNTVPYIHSLSFSRGKTFFQLITCCHLIHRWCLSLQAASRHCLAWLSLWPRDTFKSFLIKWHTLRKMALDVRM